MTPEPGDDLDIMEHLLVHRLIEAGIVLVAVVVCIVAMVVIWTRASRGGNRISTVESRSPGDRPGTDPP